MQISTRDPYCTHAVAPESAPRWRILPYILTGDPGLTLYIVCRSQVQEIQLEMASGAGGPKGGVVVPAAGAEGTIAKAKQFERNNDYARAIETYLSLTIADTQNHDALEQVGLADGKTGDDVECA